MDSHVEVPKVIYKQFLCDNKQFFYRIDISKSLITFGSPGNTRTIKDYYSENTEQYLSKIIETKLHKMITAFNIDNINVRFNKNDIETAYLYFKTLIARNVNIHNKIKNISLYLDLIKNKNDYIIHQGINSKTIDNIVEKCRIEILYNKTNTNFVLPSSGFYPFMIEKLMCIVPISKKVAFCFFINDVNDKNKINQIVLSEIVEMELVNKLNYSAFEFQMVENNGYIVSDKKEILEKILEKYNK